MGCIEDILSDPKKSFCFGILFGVTGIVLMFVGIAMQGSFYYLSILAVFFFGIGIIWIQCFIRTRNHQRNQVNHERLVVAPTVRGHVTGSQPQQQPEVYTQIPQPYQHTGTVHYGLSGAQNQQTQLSTQPMLIPTQQPYSSTGGNQTQYGFSGTHNQSLTTSDITAVPRCVPSAPDPHLFLPSQQNDSALPPPPSYNQFLEGSNRKW